MGTTPPATARHNDQLVRVRVRASLTLTLTPKPKPEPKPTPTPTPEPKPNAPNPHPNHRRHNDQLLLEAGILWDDLACASVPRLLTAGYIPLLHPLTTPPYYIPLLHPLTTRLTTSPHYTPHCTPLLLYTPLTTSP